MAIEAIIGQQHEGGLLASEGRQHAGVAIIMMASGIQGFLADGCCDDAADLVGLCHVDSAFDVAKAGLAACLVQLAEGQGHAGGCDIFDAD